MNCVIIHNKLKTSTHHSGGELGPYNALLRPTFYPYEFNTIRNLILLVAGFCKNVSFALARNCFVRP